MPRNPRWGGPPGGAAACLHCLQCLNPSARPQQIVGCLGLAVFLALLWCTACPAQSGEFLGTPQMRAEALRAIPFDQLNDATRARLLQVASKPTVYRRMPVQMIACDPDLHVFLIRYPEVIVSIWQLMEVTKVHVQRTGPFAFDASDGAGTVTRVELVYGRPDLHIFYAKGYYEGPLFGKRVEGDCLLILRSSYSRRDERDYVTNALDVFVRMDHAGADILLRTLHPLMGRAADYNFVETAKFIGQVSQASENNGPAVERLAQRLNVEPAVRDAFTKHAEVAYQRNLLRLNQQITPAGLPVQAAISVQAQAEVAESESDEISTVLRESTSVSRPPSFRR